MNALIANMAGIAAIMLIIWWFWLVKPRIQRAQGGTPIDIIVDNGVYTPARLEVESGRPVTLRFLRKDPSPCAEKVIFDDFGMSRELPLGQPVELTLTPNRPGEYEFTCQMRMYRGTLVVKDR
ncbi:MAG: cupredoxin domain-containing protein [Acidiferrobacterales bacterium]